MMVVTDDVDEAVALMVAAREDRWPTPPRSVPSEAPMMWLFAVLIVLAMGGVAMVASGRGGSMAPAYDDRPDLALPDDRPLGAQDLRTVRFPLALRGYRMSDVDALLARLATELEDRAHGLGLDDDSSGDPDPPRADSAECRSRSSSGSSRPSPPWRSC